MAADRHDNPFGTGIVPVEIEVTSGTWYTLWAPNWIQRGERWQAFLGDDKKIFVFPTSAELLAFLQNHHQHALADHPKWASFRSRLSQNVLPTDKGTISLIEVPASLAGRPGYTNTDAVSRGFDLLQSLGVVLGIDTITRWFGSFSLLHNVRRGPDHYSTANGLEEWSSVGRTVLDHWEKCLDEIEPFFTTPEVDAAAVSAAQAELDEAQRIKEEREAEEARKKAAGEELADPYDGTLWAQAGIDPIRVTLNGQYAYTLRCYVDGAPVFLGRLGQINTFPNSRALVRWIIDAPAHDLEELATWPDLVNAANAGELTVTVHDSNQYTFTGLREDIAKGVDHVDTAQLARAYELLADSADWAKDDGVNKVLLGYPRLQNYLDYMLGNRATGAVPSAPFDREVEGWRALEDGLVARFTKF